MKIPSLSPYILNDLLCSECGTPMRPKVERQNNGKIVGAAVNYFCDKCQYGISAFLQHVNCINIPYEAEPAKEVMPAPTPSPSAQATQILTGQETPPPLPAEVIAARNPVGARRA